MRTSLLFCGLLCGLFGISPVSAQGLPDFDHTNPVLLNERAVAKAREGDLTSAWILLERAVRLAPHDERIMRNLQELKAYRAGKVLGPIGQNAVPDPELQPPSAAEDKPVPPQPPAPWPAVRKEPYMTALAQHCHQNPKPLYNMSFDLTWTLLAKLSHRKGVLKCKDFG